MFIHCNWLDVGPWTETALGILVGVVDGTKTRAQQLSCNIGFPFNQLLHFLSRSSLTLKGLMRTYLDYLPANRGFYSHVGEHLPLQKCCVACEIWRALQFIEDWVFFFLLLFPNLLLSNPFHSHFPPTNTEGGNMCKIIEHYCFNSSSEITDPVELNGALGLRCFA